MPQFFTPFDTEAMPGIAQAYLQGQQMKQQRETQAIQQQQAQLQLAELQRKQADDEAARTARLAPYGGDLAKMYEQENQMGQMKAIGEFVKSVNGNKTALRTLWPMVTKSIPIAQGLNPDLFTTDGQDGVLYPYKDHRGAEIPGQFYQYKNGVIDRVEIKDRKLDEYTSYMNNALSEGMPFEAAHKGWNSIIADRKRAGATNVSTTVNNKSDTAGLSELVKDLPKRQGEAQTAINGANRIGRMLTLLDSGAGGTQGLVKAKVAPMLEVFGVKTQGLTDAQLYQRLARTLAGSLRMQVVGPGPVTEWEQKLIAEVSGGGMTGEGAARELLQYYLEEANSKINSYDSTVSAVESSTPATARAYKNIDIGQRPQQQKSMQQSQNVKAPKGYTYDAQKGYWFNPKAPKGMQAWRT